MLRHLRHPALIALLPQAAGIGSVVGARTSEPNVMLTYDDGPAPQLDRGTPTEGILSAYRDRGLVGRCRQCALQVGEPLQDAGFSR